MSLAGSFEGGRNFPRLAMTHLRLAPNAVFFGTGCSPYGSRSDEFGWDTSRIIPNDCMEKLVLDRIKQLLAARAQQGGR